MDVMDSIEGAILVALLAAFFVVIGPLLSGCASWLVGLFFEDTIRSVWRALGINLDRFSMFQIGVALGFAGSFVKATLNTSKG